MQPNNGVLRFPALEATALAVTFLTVHALVLLFIFPGFYEPFWPHHSDYYIAQALAYSEGGIRQILSEPRPLALLLFAQFGKLGVQGAVAASFAVVVANFVGIAMMLRRAFGLALSPAFFFAAAGFAYLLTSHPYQYEYSTWDLFSQLSFLFLLFGVYLGLQRYAYWQVFPLALVGFLIKETYVASASILAFAWLLHHLRSSGRRAAAPLIIILLAFIVAFALNRLNGSLFTGGADFAGSPYQIVLQPQSILAQWTQYAVEGISLASAAVIVMTIAIIALVFGPTSPITRTALAMSVAGAVAWLPNSVLPNHHHSAYSWAGAYLLFASVLLLPAAFQRGGIGTKILLAALTVAALCSPRSFTAAYAKERWIVENQQRQQRLVKALRGLIEQIPQGQSSVIVSGLNGPFSPFDHWQSILSMSPPASFHFNVMRYPPNGAKSEVAMSAIGRIDAIPGIVSWITPDQLNATNATNVWLFRSDGSLIQMAGQQTYIRDWPDFGIIKLDILRYPDLLDLVSTYKPSSLSNDERGYLFLRCGTIFLSYNAAPQAEFCLRESAKLLPRNPYSHYFLGNALEQQGKTKEARLAYSEAVKMESTSPNPAFSQALQRLSRE
ncbi:hypothetical protein CF70_000550 [Cupriavidus sp. SK-3]|uniref:tetratricopeptide repeat protein n=1 Tax=Cupriavidus sp. SK-3 TaxID=1470558 RepID=UPI0004457346|nr:hypothetical protein [Cupriavidus sp. SK-3]KDP87536.1 hypothetical protein CF70_000550 [Cupriavidus sp. SK-3]